MMMSPRLVLFAVLIFLGAACNSAPPASSPQSTVQSDLDQLDKPDQPANSASTAAATAPPPEGDEGLGDAIPAPKTGQSKVTPLSPTDSGDAELYQRFNTARAGKNMRAATEVAGEILTRNPNDFKILNALAVMAINDGKLDLARLLLGKVLQKDPTNGAAMDNMGVIELKSDNLRMALIEFKKATEADARNKSAHANLGSIYLQYKNYTNAVVELEAAVENGDQSPATLSNLGYALTGAGDYAKAQDAYDKALSKDSSNVMIMLNYAVLLVDHNISKDKATKLLNKIRFVAHEPAILNRVEVLLRKVEGKGQNGPSSVNGDLDKGSLD